MFVFKKWPLCLLLATAVFASSFGAPSAASAATPPKPAGVPAEIRKLEREVQQISALLKKKKKHHKKHHHKKKRHHKKTGTKANASNSKGASRSSGRKAMTGSKAGKSTLHRHHKKLHSRIK